MERTNDLGQDFSTVWDVWRAYNTEPSHSWQERLGLLGLAVYEGSAQRRRDLHEQMDLCEQIRRSDPEAARRVGDQWDGQVFAGVELGTRIGYALARTWPDGLEGLDDWLARARAMAGIDDGGKSDERLPTTDTRGPAGARPARKDQLPLLQEADATGH